MYAFKLTSTDLIPVKAERNHNLTRDLEYLQAFALNLHVALWSGIRNKMELAGSLVGVMLNVSEKYFLVNLTVTVFANLIYIDNES